MFPQLSFTPGPDLSSRAARGSKAASALRELSKIPDASAVGSTEGTPQLWAQGPALLRAGKRQTGQGNAGTKARAKEWGRESVGSNHSVPQRREAERPGWRGWPQPEPARLTVRLRILLLASPRGAL